MDSGHAPTLARTRHVQDDIESGSSQGMHGVARKAGHEAERLESCRKVGGRIGMNRAATALMAGVEGREQVDHLGTAYFADDDAIRPHAQRLAHQITQRHVPGTLEIGRPGLQADDMRMVWAKLSGVLDDEDPLVVRHEAENRAQDRCLARAGRAGDQE